MHNSVQNISCEINCTEVKYTATKLHKSQVETDRARSRSLLRKRDSDSGLKPRLQGTPTPHPLTTELRTTDLYKYSPDAVPPIHIVSYHVAMDKPPSPKMATSSGLGLFLATIYNQSQLAERKHVARYWSINTAATAVPLSAHPSPLVITTKLVTAILGGGLFGGGVLPAQYCPCD